MCCPKISQRVFTCSSVIVCKGISASIGHYSFDLLSICYLISSDSFYTPLLVVRLQFVSNMSTSNVCLRNQILFYFKKGKKPKQTADKICSVHGPGSIAEGAVRKWFSLFRMRDYNSKSKPSRNEKPPAEEKRDDVDVEEILESVNRSTIVEEIADSQTVSKSTVLAHLQLMVNCLH